MQNATPKIGVIVPIYNVQQYLRQCLDSVISQTYKNFHCVLVDDGSTDESLKIAQEYALKDERFVVITKENGGASSARNIGIEYFCGNLKFQNLDSENCAQNDMRGGQSDNIADRLSSHSKPAA